MTDRQTYMDRYTVQSGIDIIITSSHHLTIPLKACKATYLKGSDRMTSCMVAEKANTTRPDTILGIPTRIKGWSVWGEGGRKGGVR